MGEGYTHTEYKYGGIVNRARRLQPPLCHDTESLFELSCVGGSFCVDGVEPSYDPGIFGDCNDF